MQPALTLVTKTISAFTADPMEFTNHRKASVNIQSPASEILYKGCTPQK